MQAFFDRQLAFDTYLPGTPHDSGVLGDIFPFHIWGKNKAPKVASAEERAQAEFKKKDAIRRRATPSCFEEACAYGNLPYVILQWSQGAVDIKTRRAVYEGSDATPLMWAAFKGHLPIVRFLVDEGCDVLGTSSLGHTALHWAILSGNLDIVRFLLDRGADAWHRDKQGYDAAFVAVQNDQLPVLMMLTEDAVKAGTIVDAPEARPHYQYASPLPVNPVTQKPYYYLNHELRDVEGHSLLHWVAYRNSPSTCQYLVEWWGYPVDVLDQHGRTPLIWAAREGYPEVLEYLLSQGAMVGTRDGDGYTALQYARMRNHPEAVYVLENYPATATPSDAVGVSMADGDNNNNNVHDRLLENSQKKQRGKRYKTIRERRAKGTVAMMFTHTIFALQALFGCVYLLGTFIVMNMAPPILSHFPFGLYFFKNMLWTMLAGKPTVGSSTEKRTMTQDLGIAMSLAESVRGTWLFRLREPCNLFAVSTMMLLQVYAWNVLGCTPFLWSSTSTPDDLDESKTLFYLHTFSHQKSAVLSLDNPKTYFGGWLFNYMFPDEGYKMVRSVLATLWILTLVCMLWTKLAAMRSAMKPSEEGNIRRSPLWSIVKGRAYQWLHPRLMMLERHTQIPLRVFYCPERDVLVRNYDSYSILLDCPIGASNHVPFVLFLTFFTTFQFFMFVWGITQMKAMMGITAKSPYTPWYRGATTGFASIDTLRDIVGAQQKVPVLSTTTPTSVWSFSWLNTLMLIAFHGVPGQQMPAVVYRIEQFLADPTLIARAKFLFFYYWWPTKASVFSIWVLHFSFFAFVMGAWMTVRQWLGVWRGATRMELSNPFATGVHGDLVMIFPPVASQSMPISYDADEEDFFAVHDPENVKAVPKAGPRCIFASGNGLVNILAFLIGRNGKRWRGAMAVSTANTPTMTSPVPIVE